MKNKIIFLLASLLFTFSFNLFGLDVGDKAPSIKIKKWLAGNPVSFDFQNQQEEHKNIYVIFFWATWDSGSLHLLNFIERENKFLEDDNVVFVGISKESSERIRRFLKKIPGININIGVDDKAYSYDKYMSRISGVPMFFIIGKNGRLAWKGPPFELDRILKKIITETFDADEQLKIEQIRKKIRSASQLFEKSKIDKESRNILKIDPTDETAINIIIQSYADNREYKKALEFISSTKHKVHGNKYTMRFLYLIELRVINLMTDKQKSEILLKNLVDNYTVSFSNSPKALNELATVILQNIPFELWPLNGLLRMSERAVRLEVLFNKKSEQLGLRLQLLAKIYYHIGKIDKALSSQIKANELFKDSFNAGKGLRLALFYKRLIGLHIENNAAILQKQYSETADNLGIYLQTLGKVYYFTGKIKQAENTQSSANFFLRNSSDKQTGLILENVYKRAYELSKSNVGDIRVK